ncbi:MAG: uL15 family ribosomal protein [archaeon]
MSKRKNDFLRGKRTHGRGNTKNGRGSGCTGGKGRAGSFKHKRMTYQVLIGTKVRLKPKTRLRTITLLDLMPIIKDRKEIDLIELGYDKILGKGEINKAVIFKNAIVTKSAKEKIEKVGGKLE